MKKAQYAEYKGKTYRLLWSGKTKTGKFMARLAFVSGDKEFWVDGHAVTEKSSSGRGTPSYRTREAAERAGGYGAMQDASGRWIAYDDQ